jgi:hypothetical protein
MHFPRLTQIPHLHRACVRVFAQNVEGLSGWNFANFPEVLKYQGDE